MVVVFVVVLISALFFELSIGFLELLACFVVAVFTRFVEHFESLAVLVAPIVIVAFVVVAFVVVAFFLVVTLVFVGSVGFAEFLARVFVIVFARVFEFLDPVFDFVAVLVALFISFEFVAAFIHRFGFGFYGDLFKTTKGHQQRK